MHGQMVMTMMMMSQMFRHHTAQSQPSGIKFDDMMSSCSDSCSHQVAFVQHLPLTPGNTESSARPGPHENAAKQDATYQPTVLLSTFTSLRHRIMSSW